MNKDFEIALNKKFVKGAIEHGRAWNALSVNAPLELQGECCDFYWYADLLDDQELKGEMQGFAEKIWLRMKELESIEAVPHPIDESTDGAEVISP